MLCWEESVSSDIQDTEGNSIIFVLPNKIIRTYYESQTAAAQGKSEGRGKGQGQCFKTQNKLLQDAGLKGNEKSDERKALCKSDPG
jgi:hypothetical protein